MTMRHWHLDPNTIAALIEGRLSRGEREYAERHIAQCESCWEDYAGAVDCQVALRAPVSQSHWRIELEHQREWGATLPVLSAVGRFVAEELLYLVMLPIILPELWAARCARTQR